MEQSKAMIFVVSENSRNSVWCKYELNYFTELGKPIYCISKEAIDEKNFHLNKMSDTWFLDSDYKRLALIEGESINVKEFRIMENKYKHMDYIQSAISRMASNSFYLKGWNVTIIAAIVALSFKESDWRIYACALALNIVFWVLDAYYLKQEKLFRELYNKVSKISDDNLVDFSMNTSEFKEKVSAIPCLMIKNISITPLYLSISAVLIFLIHIV